jgi:hypothetical protein
MEEQRCESDVIRYTHGFISYSKGRLKTVRYGRNPGGLAIFVREGISRLIIDIPTVMK